MKGFLKGVSAGLLVLLLVWAGLGVLAPRAAEPDVMGQAPAELDHPGVLRLTSAVRRDAGRAMPFHPPAADAPGGQSRPLPDNWDSSHPQSVAQAGPDASAFYVWYDVPFERLARWNDRGLGIYLPTVGMNAEVFVNGQRLGSFGRMTEPVTRHFYVPMVFTLPEALLLPAGQVNRIQLLVVGYPQHRNGLGEVYVGELSALRGASLWRGFWQRTGTLISSVLTVMLGVYVLMLWLRERSNAVFGWFGLAAVVWGVRNLNLVVTELPLSNLLWSQLGVVGAVGFVGFFALFTLRYAESVALAVGDAAFSVQRWQLVVVWMFMAVCSAALLLSPDFAASRANFKYVAFFGVALTCWTQARLSRLAWRVRTLETVLIALAGVAYILLMVNDYRITNDKFSLGQYYLRQYAALPLFVAVGAMLTRRYLAALDQAQRLSASLQSQVKAQHDLLERNFDRLRAVERDQAQAQERERLMRDLHDGLGLHLLSAMMQARAGAEPTLLADTLQDCLDDLRVAVDSLAGDERDPVAVLGTLRFRMAPRLEAAGVRLDWEVDDDVPELPWLDPQKVLQLLRIAQEALTNAMRHSGATVVTMALRRRPDAHGRDAVMVSVSDNGRGFYAARPGGRGLGNMADRAKALGGVLHVENAAPGTRVVLVLPLVGREGETAAA
ncbi:MAG: hypothetical protein RLZZ618_1093 [Pseudomonadota bacterium]